MRDCTPFAHASLQGGLAVLLVFVSGVGCTRKVDRVVLEISASGLNITEELDTLELTITASRNSSGTELCEPYQVVYSLDQIDATAITLPFTLELLPGATYDRLVYVRAIGRHFGTVRFKSERMASLAGGDSRVHIAVTADCLGVGTGLGRHCQGGLELESPYWRIFDEGQYVQAGEACRVDAAGSD